MTSPPAKVWRYCIKITGPDYSWSVPNEERTRPGGLLKPNDLGLFDTLGNAWEWTQTAFIAYKTGKDGEASLDEEDPIEI